MRYSFVNLPGRRQFGEGITAEEMDDYAWVRPTVVADVKFTEWTGGGVLRHPEFVALREDKEPREVVREL
jgi:ATP-dependent DNA ligase